MGKRNAAADTRWIMGFDPAVHVLEPVPLREGITGKYGA